MPQAFLSPINASTQYCAVFGHPIRHSASPAMQNAAMATLGLNARYLAFDVQPDDLEAAIEGAKTMQFLGVNLTVPHKLLAVPMMDELDESARKWGAVNTVRFEGLAADGSWRSLIEFTKAPPAKVRSCGFNTDADGLVASLTEDMDFALKGARVLVLGAGGAGRVAAARLAEEGVGELFLVNRSVDKAERLAKEIRGRDPAVHVSVGYPNQEVDLIINATSLGLSVDDPLPLDLDRFPLTNTQTVYDMVYNPAETQLLLRAKGSDCHAVNGFGMLLHQGVKALEIWTGQPAPINVMRAALQAEVYGD